MPLSLTCTCARQHRGKSRPSCRLEPPTPPGFWPMLPPRDARGRTTSACTGSIPAWCISYEEGGGRAQAPQPNPRAPSTNADQSKTASLSRDGFLCWVLMLYVECFADGCIPEHTTECVGKRETGTQLSCTHPSPRAARCFRRRRLRAVALRWTLARRIRMVDPTQLLECLTHLTRSSSPFGFEVAYTRRKRYRNTHLL